MGAVCAQAAPVDVANAAAFGLNLGIAFQITDDLIGVVGDPSLTKKPVGKRYPRRQKVASHTDGFGAGQIPRIATQ